MIEIQIFPCITDVPAACEIPHHSLVKEILCCHTCTAIQPPRKIVNLPPMLVHWLLLPGQEMKVAVSASNNIMLTMQLWSWIEGEIKTQWFREKSTLAAWSIHSALHRQPDRKQSYRLLFMSKSISLSNQRLHLKCILACCRYEKRRPVPKAQLVFKVSGLSGSLLI